MSVFYDFILRELRSGKYKWSSYSSPNLNTTELYKPKSPNKVFYLDSLEYGRIIINSNDSAGGFFTISNIVVKDKSYSVYFSFDKDLKNYRTSVNKEGRGWKVDYEVEKYCNKIANEFFEVNKEAFEQLIKQQKDELDELNQYELTKEQKEKIGYLMTLRTSVSQLPKEEQDVLLTNDEAFTEYLCKLIGK